MRLDIPDSWKEALEIIVHKQPKRILVLGGVDVGKSTLCLYLLRELLERGFHWP